MYADSHAHLGDEKLFVSIESLLERAREAGVSHIVSIATDRLTLQRGKMIQEQAPHVLLAGATPPHDVALLGEKDFSCFAESAYQKELIAIGETGLDYYYAHSPRELQQEFLRRYLRLAKETALPVIIHCREAFSDLFAILDQEYSGYLGILHCFTGTQEEANELVARGWMVSFSGIVTFKKNFSLQEVAASLPLSHLLVETDAPYLAPQSRRGHCNEPAYLPEIVAWIAHLKGISTDEVAAATKKNLLRLLGLLGE